MTTILPGKFVRIMLAAFALGPAFGHQAWAQTSPSNCVDRGVLIERLADGWGEARLSIALVANGSVLETFANLDTGTWTIAVTAPGGPTCVVAVGSDFQLIEPQPAGEES